MQSKCATEERETNNTTWGKFAEHIFNSQICVVLTSKDRIDGAFEPWISRLLSTLLELFPLPSGLEIIPRAELPPPRVALLSADEITLQNTVEPLDSDSNHYTAVLKCNKRITAEDWFQDVRHFELKFEDQIRCIFRVFILKLN